MTDDIETLRRELAETRAVLEDMMHERRPSDLWLLKLIGRREDLLNIVECAFLDGDCRLCGEHESICAPPCLRGVLYRALTAAPVRGV